MPTRKYSSRSQQTTLTAALTSSATSVVVVSGSALLGGTTISAGETFTVVIDPDTALEEIVDVTAVSTNTLTVTRGIDGSTGQAHSAGAVVRHMAIGRDYREANQHIENTTTAHGITLANLVKTTDTGTVTSTMITDGTIVNADINASAAIADTKLGTISTAGKVSNSATTATSANTVSAIVARDASGNFTAGTVTANLTGNVTGNVTGSSGSTTGNAATATALATARTFQLTGDVEASGVTFDGTGNVSLTTVIGTGAIVNADVNTSAQIAYSKLNLTNGIVNADINASAAIALSKLATDPLARANHTGTQAASTISDFDTQVRTSRLDQMAAPTAAVSANSQKITNLGTPTSNTDASTKAYVDTSIANLIDGAPSTLDTLNEIAAALADNASFSDTVVLKSGSTMSGALAMGTNKITGLGDPTNAQDAATKNYIDTAVLAPSNLTGPITSVGNVTSIASQTGTGSKFVVDNTPTLITPVLGVATATSINGTTIPTSKTLVATDSTQYVVPSQSGNNGKYLTTDGTTSSWGTIQAGSQVKIEGGTAVTYDFVDFLGMGTDTGTAGTIKVQPLTPTGASTGKRIFTGTTTPSSPTSGDVWVDAALCRSLGRLPDGIRSGSGFGRNPRPHGAFIGLGHQRCLQHRSHRRGRHHPRDVRGLGAHRSDGDPSAGDRSGHDPHGGAG